MYPADAIEAGIHLLPGLSHGMRAMIRTAWATLDRDALPLCESTPIHPPDPRLTLRTLLSPGIDFDAQVNSSKWKGVDSGARIEEVNCKAVVSPISGKLHQLVRTDDYAVLASVDIDSTIVAWRVRVVQDLAPHRLPVGRRSEHQTTVSIARASDMRCLHRAAQECRPARRRASLLRLRSE